MTAAIQKIQEFNGATFAVTVPKIYTKGVTITTGGTAVAVGIPNKSDGLAPNYVRLASTAACYARLGAPSEQAAVVATAGTGYVSGEQITLAGGTFTQALVLQAATLKLLSAAVLNAGTGYAPADTITLAGGTSSVKAILTVDTVGGSGEVATFTVSTAGDYSVTTDTFTQFATSGSGIDATFDTGVFGLITVSVATNGAYTVYPTNPVAQGSTTGVGTGADFTVTWATAAAAGDILIYPGDALVIGAAGFDTVSAIQVTAAGVLQISPIDA